MAVNATECFNEAGAIRLRKSRGKLEEKEEAICRFNEAGAIQLRKSHYWNRLSQTPHPLQ